MKAQRAVSSAFGRERASGFSQTIGFWWSVADLEYYMGYVDNMAKQSLTDLRSYAAKYIVGKPRVTGVVIPADATTVDRAHHGGFVAAEESRSDPGLAHVALPFGGGSSGVHDHRGDQRHVRSVARNARERRRRGRRRRSTTV